MYLGIDGCRAGWVFACITPDSTLRFELVDRLSSLARSSLLNPVQAECALIDIPIGFPGAGYRLCDREARRLLSPFRRMSVFFTLVKDALYADSYEAACEVNFEQTGKKISKQAWAIGGKILETYEYLKRPAHLPLRESHPELCFRAFSGEACRHGKKTAEGRRERLAVIDRFGADYGAAIEEYIRGTKRKDVQPDDIIDAAVLALTASMPDRLCSIPAEADFDAEGQRREIVFPVTAAGGIAR